MVASTHFTFRAILTVVAGGMFEGGIFMKSVALNGFWVVACLAVTCLPVMAQTQPTPEPSTMLLVAGAGGALIIIRQLRKKK